MFGKQRYAVRLYDWVTRNETVVFVHATDETRAMEFAERQVRNATPFVGHDWQAQRAWRA